MADLVLLGPQEVNTRLMLQSQHRPAAHREHVVEDVGTCVGGREGLVPEDADAAWHCVKTALWHILHDSGCSRNTAFSKHSELTVMVNS